MPKIKDIANPLYGYHNSMAPGSLSTPTIAGVHFDPGELNKKELEHARAVAGVEFIRLIWYAKEMNKTGCRYREAVITVNKRIKELN